MPKVILISQSPLPATKIGSWTTLYKNYLEADHKIDILICKKPKLLLKKIKYQFINDNLIIKIISRIKKKSHLNALFALNKVTKNDTKYIIQVVDNFKIITDLENLLIRKRIRKNCYIQFFYHGFAPYLENNKSIKFFKAIDEMVLLTNDSYKKHKSYYNALPCKFTVLYNGIDDSKFKMISSIEKLNLKKKLNIRRKTVFFWCSQDRPKKGLNLILDAWREVYANNQEIVLLVVGSSRNEEIEGVCFIGRIPNNELPKYYQASDVYLFSSLCQEGFGLSLIEALHCGCYCIASSIGGIPEVLEYGKFGELVERPHFIKDWVDAINGYLKIKSSENNFHKELYTTKSWNSNMNKIITGAKLVLDKL